MIRFTCVIDTSSYINLCQSDSYLGKTLLSLLSSHVNLKMCSEINRVEIPNHYNSLMPTTTERSNQVYKLSKRKTYKNYENKMFDSISNFGDRNRGEKHNLAVIVDLYLTKKTKGLIFLTDDQSALRGCLNGVVDAFPFARIWNSFDVVLLLFIEYKTFTLDIAKAAIRDINALLATNDPNMSQDKTQKRIQTLKKYTDYLTRINKVIN